MKHRGEPSENSSLIQPSLESSSYNTLTDDRQGYNWNVEIDVKGQVNTGPEEERFTFSFQKLLKYTGPDPGNLESDLQAGAIAGYKLLWLLLWSHMAGLMIQILSARLGVVTQKHLAQLIRKNYTRPASVMIWIFTQLAIIGSDIQEIIGTAIALKIIFRLKLWIGVMITATDTFFFMWLQQYGVRKMETFFMSLIGLMIACFWIEMFASHPNMELLLKGILVPEIPEDAKVQAVGMVGCVIMPHNMFLHSALVMSRHLGQNPSDNKKKEANFYFAIESTLALITSYLINLAIVVVFAQVFYNPGQVITQLPGLYDASEVLSSTLGKYAKYFWALGLLAAGQCSTMTGTLAGQYVVEGFLGAIFKKQWHRVAVTRAVALVPSMIVAIYAVDRFDTMGEFLNVLQSLCLPAAIIPILKLTASSKIMSPNFKNSLIMNLIACWPTYAVVFGLIYFAFVVYLIYMPLEIPVDDKETEVVGNGGLA
ncbi:Nramp-domain-containing protein [Rhizopus microsporus var. microsporus]|uniref:Nramp-domain-containing protein n=1 Tax=Rhizopus microsporus var. microsporus TaxID=86635 RepID=A0A1X0R051_RHIZD|nr:Nramp-domain-containing protein [Rhizopus microsporus var. microsporus]